MGRLLANQPSHVLHLLQGYRTGVRDDSCQSSHEKIKTNDGQVREMNISTKVWAEEQWSPEKWRSGHFREEVLHKASAWRSLDALRFQIPTLHPSHIHGVTEVTTKSSENPARPKWTHVCIRELMCAHTPTGTHACVHACIHLIFGEILPIPTSCHL